jgi:hypothetical protein
MRCPNAGNGVQVALQQCMPPRVQLQCRPVSWLPGRLLELQLDGELE